MRFSTITYTNLSHDYYPQALVSLKKYMPPIIAQALVSFKKYMPPPLPYFKVNICPFSLPHFALIFFAYL
jgi:hypothetical protein